MSSRPRRTAAQRATVAITDMADRDNERTMSSRSRRSADSRGLASASVSRGPPPSSSPASSPADANQHIHLNIKLPSSKLRQATTPSKRKAGGNDEGSNKRSSRGIKKSYVVESDSDEDDDPEPDDDDEEEPDEEEDDDEEDEVEEEDEIEVGDVTAVTAVEDDEDGDEEMADPGDEAAEGDEDVEGEEIEDEMDVDAEGEEDDDAEGDIDIDVAPTPNIKSSKPSKSASSGNKGKGVAVPKQSSRPSGSTRNVVPDDDDDDELSELESGAEEINDTVEVGGRDRDAEGEDEDLDAEGEEIEVAEEDAEGEVELDSDEDGSRAGTPDLSRMTARQRAKHGDVVHEYMKLSDEVQVKKHFTAEELSMRRAEMARRRRNLSEKRNEEVKMETINKLLKKQAPKTNRRVALLPRDESPDGDQQRANPVFVRWISTKEGSKLAIPDDMVAGPMAPVFGLGSGKMVEEVL